MIVIGFDRDLTVDVNGGPIPLALVRRFAGDKNFEVWAIGNQRLKEEAGIPGIDEMKERLGQGPKSRDNKKNAELNILSKTERNIKAKIERCRMLKQLFPSATKYIVVGDFDVSAAEGWEWFSPAAFLNAASEIQST